MLFHSPDRIKQITSIERFMLIANLFADTNLEHYYDIPETWRLDWDEEAMPIAPWHGVFGHQSGPEAAGSAALFAKHFKFVTDAGFSVSRNDFNGNVRAKDWRVSVPRGAGYTVGRTAAWRWQRFIADGLKNCGPLERAHLYALLAQGTDLAAVLHQSATDTPVSLAELEHPTGRAWLAATAATRVPLDDRDEDLRIRTNDRIGAAIDFVMATPFMLAEEGR